MEVPGRRRVSGSKVSESGPELCEACARIGSSNQANGYCRDCKVFWCQECFDGHLVAPSCKHHYLGPLSDGRAGCEACTRKGSSKKADGFCVDCQVYWCRRCFEGHLAAPSCKLHVLGPLRDGKLEKDTRNRSSTKTGGYFVPPDPRASGFDVGKTVKYVGPIQNWYHGIYHWFGERVVAFLIKDADGKEVTLHYGDNGTITNVEENGVVHVSWSKTGQTYRHKAGRNGQFDVALI